MNIFCWAIFTQKFTNVMRKNEYINNNLTKTNIHLTKTDKNIFKDRNSHKFKKIFF